MPPASVILANRAYVDHNVPPTADAAPPTGAGGLLEAVRPAIAPWDGEHGSVWIGAGRGKHDRTWVDHLGYELIDTPRGPLRHRRLFFSDAAWNAHYLEASNAFLWPLLHLVREPLPDRVDYYPRPQSPGDAAWAAFEGVNDAFATAAARETDGPAWIHDYQLGLVPAALRARGFDRPIGFFLHTRFPRLDLALRYLDGPDLDRYRQWVQGILGADLVGLQSPSDVAHFLQTVNDLCGAIPVTEGPSAVIYEGRTVRVDSYPVGIDTKTLANTAETAELPEAVTDLVASGLPLVVGLERSDYTKGIPERLQAVRIAIEHGARFAYAGIASPTRQGVAAYDDLAKAIEREAALAETVARNAGLPFLNSTQALAWPEVVALLREADVVFTSSLADGMNLVPLQAAIAQVRRAEGHRGVLLVGKDAGAAETFDDLEEAGLVPVDPFDPASMAIALAEALEGRPGRITDELIFAVRGHDATGWGAVFLEDLEATRAH